jgi:hypothetical protein
MSLLETLYQSLIFRHQLSASLSSARLVFKQPLHQLGEVFHDFLQGWLTGMIRVGKAKNCSKVNSFKGAAVID